MWCCAATPFLLLASGRANFRGRRPVTACPAVRARAVTGRGPCGMCAQPRLHRDSDCTARPELVAAIAAPDHHSGCDGADDARRRPDPCRRKYRPKFTWRQLAGWPAEVSTAPKPSLSYCSACRGPEGVGRRRSPRNFSSTCAATPRPLSVKTTAVLTRYPRLIATNPSPGAL
jgi:hypothetical protein